MLQIANKLGAYARSKSTAPSTKLGRTQSASPAPRRLIREYRIEASELKIGDVIEHKNKLLEVTKLQHTFGAQRAASMQAEFKDIRTGNKGQDKFRVSEEVEVADLDWKEVDFEGEKDGKFEFSDDDGEPFMLPKTFFAGKEPWLSSGVRVQVRMLDEEPLYYRFHKRYQVLQIKNTKEVEQKTPHGKPAELSNGVTIKVPPFMQIDAWIKVDVITEEYVSKEDGPPPEDEYED